ncbi:unnamed protein product, partial [Arabidopsis halleri]
FVRVKVRISITDRLRFFRRVRFESRERAMIGFEYERLPRICINCCRINHHANHCPYLAALVDHANNYDVLVVPIWEEGTCSNNLNHHPLENSSHSSDISSYSPTSHPPPPASPALHSNEFVVGPPPTRFAFSRSTSNQASSGSSSIRGKIRYEIEESSKRKKGKQIDLNSEKNTRRCRKNHVLRFHLVDGQPP